MLWPSEETVSIHSEAELKNPTEEECRVVGAVCTVRFKRSLYDGIIVCIGEW